MVRRKTASRRSAAALYYCITVDHGWHKKSFEDFAGEFSGLRLAALRGAGSRAGHSIQHVARPFGMRRIGS
jgi:hypothetical protein